MEDILAQWFAPLNFLVVLGFPNLVPPTVRMDGLTSYFQIRPGDNSSQHLITFDQCMDQIDIQHEDVLMKMFMYYLKGDARKWYFSLPSSNICSLRDSHVAFNKHYKRYFPHEMFL